jgi:hypothetical protein
VERERDEHLLRNDGQHMTAKHTALAKPFLISGLRVEASLKAVPSETEGAVRPIAVT